jgi:choice-of-anchor A domain-containing protein
MVSAVALLTFACTMAQASPVNLGAAAGCTALILPGGSSIDLTINGGAAVEGNVCVPAGMHLDLGSGAKVGPTVGTGDVVSGTIFLDPNGATVKLDNQNPASVVIKDLSQAVLDAIAANNTAAALSPTQNFNQLDISSGTFAITGNGGLNVISVANDVKLHGSGTLLLTGTANDKFVINVAGAYTQSSTSNVMLGGGVRADNVMWNFIGGGNGPNIGASGQVTYGTFLAPFRDFSITDTTLYGQVISQGHLAIGSKALVVNTVPEAGSTLALCGIGLIGIWAVRRKLPSSRA